MKFNLETKEVSGKTWWELWAESETSLPKKVKWGVSRTIEAAGEAAKVAAIEYKHRIKPREKMWFED